MYFILIMISCLITLWESIWTWS